MNTNVLFLTIVRSMNQTSGHLTRQGQDCRVNGPEVPTEMTTTCVQCVLCGGALSCCRINPGDISRPLPANNSTQSLQCVAFGIHVSFCALRHEFNVDDSWLCVPAIWFLVMLYTENYKKSH